MSDWKIATDSGSVRVLTQHPDLLPYDKIIVEFLKDNILVVSAYKEGEFKLTKESLWAENEKFDKLAFPDDIFLFNPDVSYKIDELTREELTLKGAYTIAGTTYPDVTWVFDKL